MLLLCVHLLDVLAELDGAVTELLVAHLLLEVGTVLGVGGVELLEVELLSIADVVHESGVLSATEDPDTAGLHVARDAVEVEDTKRVLAHALAAGDNTLEEVARVGELLEVLVVLEVPTEDAVALVVEVVPESGEEVGVVGLLEEEGALHVIELHSRRGEEVERVELLLLLGGGILLLVIVLLLSSGLGLGSSLGGRGGLGGSDGGGSLARGKSLSGGEGELTNDGLDGGLLHDGLEPADDVGHRLAERGVDELGEGVDQSTSNGEISDGDLVADEVGVVEEVLVEDLKSLGKVLLGLKVSVHLEGEDVEVGEDPDSAGGLNLVVNPVEPLVDESLLEEVGTEEVGVATETSNVLEDSVGLVDGASGGLEDGDLARGVHLQELGGLVVRANLDLNNLDINLVDASSNEGLPHTVVVGVSVNALRGGI